MLRLPPLSTLPVLEATARLQSFALAATELNVTHGAVSHQIRSLEDYLGVALFLRVGRGVKLTAEGAALAEVVRQSLLKIADATATLSPQERERKLRISVVPSFAGRWLMSRLGHFLEANPQYEIAVDANHMPSNFTTDNIDVAVRFGVGPWAGVYSEFLANDTYILVCSPKLNRGKLPTKPAQLARFHLLLQERDLWEHWFALAGVAVSPPSTGIDYNDSTIFVQQAINGEGIGLLRRSLVNDAIKAGSLVQLFDITFKSTRSYHLVCLPQSAKSAKIRAFRSWLVNEIDWSQE